MITARDIVTEAQNTDTFLEEMRVMHKRRLRKAIRTLEDRMINLMSRLDVKPNGRLEGIKVNLKQSQKIHSKMLKIFEEEYGQKVGRTVGEYGQIATHIKRSWRSLGESIHFTDIDKAMLTSLQEQSYDQFAQFGEMAQRRMADAMYSSVVAGTSYAQLLKAVQGILRGHRDVRGRPMTAYANTHAFDAVMNFHNQVNIKKSEDLGINKFMYVGDVIETTRPFCRRRAGGLYTRRQIEAWNRLSWTGKSGPALTHRGGYNCRHHWRGFKDEWLDQEDEVGEMIEDQIFPDTPEIKEVKAKIAVNKKARGDIRIGRQKVIKERRELRTKIKATTSKAAAAPFKQRLSLINKELKVITGQRSVLGSELDSLKVELKKLRDDIRKLPPTPKVIKPKKVAPKKVVPPEPVVPPVTPPPPPPPPVIPLRPEAGQEIAKMKGELKVNKKAIKELNLVTREQQKLRLANAKERVLMKDQLKELEDKGGDIKAIRALKKRIDESEKVYSKMFLEKQERYEIMAVLKKEGRKLKSSISSAEFRLARGEVTPPLERKVTVVTGTTEELEAEVVKYKKRLKKLVKDNPQKHVHYDSWLDAAWYEGSSDPIRKMAYQLNVKLFESRMNWYRSLPRERKVYERRMVIDSILRRNNATKYKSVFTKGTDHMSYRLLAELDRHELRIDWHEGFGRAGFFEGKINFYKGNNYTTIAHEVAHAIDSLCASGFRGDWGYTGFVWKNNCPYVTKRMRDDLRKWYKSHQSGKLGVYHNGDGKYFKNDWISDYEGRIYSRPLTDVSTAMEGAKNLRSFGQEWWSMNAQRYNSTVRQGQLIWEREIQTLKDSIDFAKKDIVKYGADAKLSSNITAFESQLAKLNRPGELEAYINRALETSNTWQQVRRVYPNLAGFLEDFFSTVTAT